MGAMAGGMANISGKLPGMGLLNKLPGMGLANQAANKLTGGRGLPGMQGVPGFGGKVPVNTRGKLMKGGQPLVGNKLAAGVSQKVGALGQLTPQGAMGGAMGGPMGLMTGGAPMMGAVGDAMGGPQGVPPAMQQMTPGAAAQGGPVKPLSMGEDE